MDIDSIISTLAHKRPIFHSEADFQHALAWHTKLRHEDAEIRLEIPADFAKQSRASIDMLARSAGRIYYFELKYKTTHSDFVCMGERFRLKKQGAKDQGSYSFIKDIMRIESFIGNDPASYGYAILLTNDSTYWTGSRKSEPIDADFHLIDGRELGGRLMWAAHAGKGSIERFEEPLVLRGRYRLKWINYPSTSPLVCSAFRYLCVEIAPTTTA